MQSVDKQNAKKMFSRRQVLRAKFMFCRESTAPLALKTGLNGFVVGDSKLELAFLIVSCLLDNVFMNNNKKNKK